MRLMSRALGDAGPLSRFLAVRRQPGTKWQRWESVAVDLRDATGELISREGLHSWALAYGIPDTNRASDHDQYVQAMERAGIEI